MSTELKKPEEVFNGDDFPDDLKWIMSSFNLPKNDPAVVLMAWHWKRVQSCNDSIQSGIFALRAALDSRVEKITTGVAVVEELTGHLEGLSAILSEKPLYISRQVEEELQKPITASVQACESLSDRLRSLLDRTDRMLKDSTRKQVWAAFLSGLVIGSMLIPWTYSHFFSVP